MPPPPLQLWCMLLTSQGIGEHHCTFSTLYHLDNLKPPQTTQSFQNSTLLSDFIGICFRGLKALHLGLTSSNSLVLILTFKLYFLQKIQRLNLLPFCKARGADPEMTRGQSMLFLRYWYRTDAINSCVSFQNDSLFTGLFPSCSK